MRINVFKKAKGKIMFNKDHNSTHRFTPMKVVAMVLVFSAIAAALSAAVMYLWNAILPDAIGVKPLTFWKAAGLLLLTKILFGGLGKIFGGKRFAKRREWRKKWMQMSPEERLEAKSRWKEYCRKRRRGEED